MPKELFDILAGHPFDGDHCFLCGVELNTSNRTVEHVFPKWLQESFGLRDQTIGLLNLTKIPYRNLVIPCCKQCNGVHLSKLENKVRSVILDGSKSLNEIADADINAWLSKIYVGLLWKELELAFDRRNPDAGPILHPAAMANFRMVHFFMQSCRKSMSFQGLNGAFANSIYRIECLADKYYGDFDYLDNFSSHCIGVRMGNKGIIAAFDGGLHAFEFPDFLEMKTEQKSLHPIQFKEIFAALSYKSSLSLRVPYYGLIYHGEADHYTADILAFDDENMTASSVTIAAENGPITMIPIISDAALSGPSYGPWSQEAYARVLTVCTGIPFDQLFSAPDMVATFLRDREGKFREIRRPSTKDEYATEICSDAFKPPRF